MSLRGHSLPEAIFNTVTGIAYHYVAHVVGESARKVRVAMTLD